MSAKPTHWTLMFKHCQHTILILTDPLTPFNTLKTELLTTLHERYPDGLPRPSTPTSSTPLAIPSPGSIMLVSLAVLEDDDAEEKVWTELDTSRLGQSPQSLGLKDGSQVAFCLLGDEDEEPRFEVMWSSYDDYEDEEVMEEDGE